MTFWCLCSKVSVKRENERAEIRWMWLREKAIMAWTRVMGGMIKVGRSWAQYRVS